MSTTSLYSPTSLLSASGTTLYGLACHLWSILPTRLVVGIPEVEDRPRSLASTLSLVLFAFSPHGCWTDPFPSRAGLCYGQKPPGREVPWLDPATPRPSPMLKGLGSSSAGAFSVHMQVGEGKRQISLSHECVS
jgi:hypothetical protein